MQKHLFPELGIDPDLLKAIESLGFEQPSPIQEKAIPVGLSGRDVVGQSQTGSGKTLAFAVPALQLIAPADRAVQVLILCPTRELAIQVNAEIHKLLPFKRGISATPIYGGAPYDRQIRAIRNGVQIVVGTPGRVLDFIRKGTLNLGGLKLLVLDEADEMLNMGFRDEIEEMMSKVPKDRQTILFSATISKPIHNLITNYTRDPVTITIEHKTLTVPTIDQRYYEVMGRSKLEVLCRVMDIEDAKRSIVFANTKRAVDDITDSLSARGFTVDRLHGDLTQTMRDRVMRNFRNGTIEVLVATDVASRGLDVDDVNIIFNFDLPYDEEDYVHRIGRTGRAGKTGKAVSLVVGREIYLLERIQRYIKTRVQRAKVPSQEEVENTRIDLFFEKLKHTLESKEFTSHDHTIQRCLDAGFSSTDISSALLDMILQDSARQGEEIPEDRSQRPRYEENRRPTGKGEDSDRRPGPSPSRAPVREQRQRTLPQVSDRRVRMFVNIGMVDEVQPGQIAGAIYNTSGLPQGSLGAISIFERSSYVEIPEDFVDQVIKGVEGTVLRGRRLRMDVAERPGARPDFKSGPRTPSKSDARSDFQKDGKPAQPTDKKRPFHKKNRKDKDKGKPQRLKRKKKA